MLSNLCNIKSQRFSDQLFFNKKYHCDQTEAIINSDCIHLKSKNTIIFLNSDDLAKLEAITPLIKNFKTEQLINISNALNQPGKEMNFKTICNKLNNAFNRKFGWFFKNGNK